MICQTRYSNSLEPDALFAFKSDDCPFCRRQGFLVGHGNIRGYSPNGSPGDIRGKRLFCSNRGSRRKGCGRTFSILKSSRIKRHLVPTFVVWSFLTLFLGGLTIKGAWMAALSQTGARFCDSLGYKLWPKVRREQSVLRPHLCGLVEPPSDTGLPVGKTRDSCATQLLEHLRRVFAESDDPISAFQLQLQMGFFSSLTR